MGKKKREISKTRPEPIKSEHERTHKKIKPMVEGKIRIVKLAKTIPNFEDFDGEPSEWFELLHEASSPDLSKFERNPNSLEVITFSGNGWDFFKNALPDTSPKKGDGPFVLVLSSSADRCCEIIKDFKKCPGKVAKLFARHMKVDEQGKFLKSNSIGFAFGTPNRVLKLCEMELLKLENIKHIVVDCQENSKSFTILNLPEVSQDFFALYRRFLSRITSAKLLLLFPNRLGMKGESSPTKVDENISEESEEEEKE